MLKKTKIICTMGPATEREGVLDALIANGMNCARFNFSHGTHPEHQARIAAVREAAKKAGRVISLILDTKGPEMRLGEFADGKVELTKGDVYPDVCGYAGGRDACRGEPQESLAGGAAGRYAASLRRAGGAAGRAHRR